MYVIMIRIVGLSLKGKKFYSVDCVDLEIMKYLYPVMQSVRLPLI